MKKRYLILALIMLISMLTLPVSAAQGDMTYSFDLTANGKDTVEVSLGDIITVTLRLRRTDADSAYQVHGMQAELRYDASFLELVEGSGTAYTGVNTSDIALVDGHREYYMNFLSMSGSTTWEADTLIGSVQFKVIGESGVTKITNEDFLVSQPDGSGSYKCEANELLVILTTDCTVKFQSNGGTEVESQKVQFGEKVIRPEDPIREGYELVGWFTDIHMSQKWDFENDTVEGNMTLYAKWTEKTENTGPDEPAVPGGDSNDGNQMHCWIWWLLILLLLILLALLYVRKRIKSSKKRH